MAIQTKTERDEFRQKENRIRERKRVKPHTHRLLTDRECMKVYGKVTFPGRHRPENISKEDWEYELALEVQDSYPATGEGSKSYEPFDRSTAETKYFEHLNMRFAASENWLRNTPGAYEEGGICKIL